MRPYGTLRGTPAARLMPSQSSERQACRGDLDERLPRLHATLVVFPQAAIATQPGKTPFNYSATGLDTEAAGAWHATHNL
jgi:hypothetical protein